MRDPKPNIASITLTGEGTKPCSCFDEVGHVAIKRSLWIPGKLSSSQALGRSAFLVFRTYVLELDYVEPE